MKNWRKLFAFAVASLASTFIAFAQSQTGRITGRITDPSGAAVAGVEVIATDEATGVATKVGEPEHPR